jgi:hypothetical protein
MVVIGQAFKGGAISRDASGAKKEKEGGRFTSAAE